MFRITRIHHQGALYSTWLKFMPIVHNVHDVCSCGIIVSYVTKVLLVSYVYRSTGLSYVILIACVTFDLVYSTWVDIIITSMATDTIEPFL